MRRIREWLEKTTTGLYVLLGDTTTAERVAATGAGPGVDLTGLTVPDCVRALGGTSSPTELAAALAARDGGDVTIVLRNLEAAADPEGIAGTVARRLATEPGVRVIVTMTAPGTALRLLEPVATVDDRTSWTRRWERVQRPEHLTRLTGHRSYIRALTTVRLPGGRPLVASGCEDGDIRLWDPIAREQFGGPLHAHGDGVRALTAFPGDDGLLVSGGEDGFVRLWTPRFGRIIGEHDFAEGVQALALLRLHDENVVAAASGSRVQLWVPGGDVLREMAIATGVITGLAAHEHDGRVLLAAAAYDGPVTAWDAATGELLWERPERSDAIASVGPFIAVHAGSAGRFLDPMTGETVRDAPEPHRGWRNVKGNVTSLAAIPLPGGPVLATAGSDDRVRLTDPVTGDALGGAIVDGEGIHAEMTGVALPDGRGLVAVSTGKDLWLWDTAHAEPPGPRHGCRSATLGAGGVLTTTDLYEIHRWDFATGERLGVFTPEDVQIVQRAFTLADGRSLVPDNNFRTRVWDPVTGELVAKVPASYVRHVRLPDGTDRLASATSFLNPSADDDPPVCLWDPLTGEETTVIAWPGGRIRFQLPMRRPNGDVWLACRTDDKDVLFFDAVTGANVGAPMPAEVREHYLLCALADGRLLTGDDAGGMRAWEPETARASPVFSSGRGGPVRVAAELPHGWLATGEDGAVALWTIDGDEAARIGEIPCGKAVLALHATPDGELVVGTELGVAVYDVRTDRSPGPLPDPAVHTPAAAAVDRKPNPLRVAWQSAPVSLGQVHATPDGLVIAVDDDDRLHVFTQHGSVAREPIQGPEGARSPIAAGGTLAVFGVDGEYVDEDEEEHDRRVIALFDLATGEALPPIEDTELSTYGLDARRLCFTTDGNAIGGVVGNEWGASATLWDLATRTPRHTLGVPSVSDVYAQAVAPFELDGRPCAAVSLSDMDQDDDQSLLVVAFDVTTGDRLNRGWHYLPSDRTPMVMAGLPGDPVVAVATADGPIKLRRVMDGAPVATLAGPGPVEFLASGFADGVPVVAARHADWTVTVWDAAAGTLMASGDVPGGSIAITSGGLLVTAATHGLTAYAIG